MDCILHGQKRREPAELNGEGSAGTGQCTVQTLKLSWSWSLKQASAVLSIIITVSRWMWRRPHVCEYYSRLHPETNINRAEQWAEKKRSRAVISSCKGDQLTVSNNSVKHCGGENNSVCFTSKTGLCLLSALYTDERPRAKSAAQRLLSLVNF